MAFLSFLRNNKEMEKNTRHEFGNLRLEAYLKTNNPGFVQNLEKFVPQWHLDMLKDQNRLTFYDRAIAAQVKDKVVLDIGSGSGILSYLALKHGAKKVYSVEIVPFFQDFYAIMLEESIAQGRAQLIRKNAKDLSRSDFGEEAPEVVIHEIFSWEGFSEDIVDIFQRLQTANLFNDVSFIPSRFKLYCQGVNLEDKSDTRGIEDFEGYELSKLNAFLEKKKFLWSYSKSKYSKFETTGAPKLLYETEFPQFRPFEDLSVDFSAAENPTHARVWMGLECGKEKLETLHDLGESHWSNGYFQLAPYEFEGQPFKANFTIANQQLMLNGCSKA